MKHKLSIIVPIYNIHRYLCRCVDNIINQGYKDYECILVDDGTPDDCSAISDDYALQDNRIIVIHKTNTGVSNSRNIGIKQAIGDYITFCDGDDYYTQGWLKGLIDEIHTNDVDFVTSGYRYVDELDNDILVFNRKVGLWELNNKEDRIDYIINHILYNGNGWEVWSSLFKKEIINRYDVKFCETCDNYAEDLAFVMVYSLYAHKMSAISGTGYRYVKHVGSMMDSSTNEIKLNSFNEVSKFFGDYFYKEYESNNRDKIFNLVHFYIMHIGVSRLLYSNKYNEIKRLPSEYKMINDKNWNDNHAIIPSNLTKSLSVDAEYMKVKNVYKYIFRRKCIKYHYYFNRIERVLIK